MIEFRNPLARGFYTISDAARLIEVGSAQRIRGWLNGYSKSGIGPLLHREYHPIDNVQELSFYDLMEIRFVEHFRNVGVRVQTLRQIMDTARIEFGVDKPLLKQDVLFIPTNDKRKVVVEEIFTRAAEDNNDTKLWDMVRRQYEFADFIEGTLARGLAFDPRTAVISEWAPRAREFPDIIINPSIAYGQPAIPKRIPTLTLFDMWKAESEDVSAVADWFDVPVTQVDMAVAFEQLLLEEGRKLAA